MALNVSLDELLLRKNLTDSEEQYAQMLLDAVHAWFSMTYGDRITENNQAFFIPYISEAILRKLQRTNTTILSQSMEGAQVQYAAHSTKGGIFLPQEVAEMDAALGMGGFTVYYLDSTNPNAYVSPLDGYVSPSNY